MPIDIKPRRNKNNIEIHKEDYGNKIAIIGMDCNFPQADDSKAFYKNLINRKDFISFPSEARQEYIRRVVYNNIQQDLQYAKGSYFSNIDEFDYQYFNLSKREAKLMDPHHRLFLQSAVRTFENAGYGGEALKGSETGVYVSDIDDFRYIELIKTIDPESFSMATVGNIKAMIASRLSYIFDFKGPSMMIDTTCSSSLVAIHMACEDLKRGSCKLALAGGVRLSLLPVVSDRKIGIESSTGLTKTFDDSSDGTAFSEGVVTLLLKPLGRAIKDHDYIYAVIRGSEVNHDGTSVGMTAPNREAQKQLIYKTIEEADIHPNEIAFIEAHGTGTKLGDPIEIAAIQEAYKAHIKKNQFCAVGSVKSNIGHLGNIAGLAGLVKGIMSQKYGLLPPTIHFNYPNRNIDFIESPVFVSDRSVEIDSTKCFAISSFGLSGTNCHMIIEPAPKYQKYIENNKHELIFTISAKSEKSLFAITKKYIDYLSFNNEVDFYALCANACINRGHYQYRLAIPCNDLLHLKKALLQFLSGKQNDSFYYYGIHAVISDERKNKKHYEIYQSDQLEFTEKINQFIDQNSEKNNIDICLLYCRGAKVDWTKFYTDSFCKFPLPVYEFEKSNCLLEVASDIIETTNIPIFSYVNAVQSVHEDIFIYEFSVEKDWVISEHKISEKYFPPGTLFIELLHRVLVENYQFNSISLSDLVFISPMAVEPNMPVQLQIIIKKEDGYIQCLAASNNQMASNEWEMHLKCKAIDPGIRKIKKIDINKIIKRCNEKPDYKTELKHSEKALKELDLGDRWNQVQFDFHKGENEVLVSLKLPPKYYDEINACYLHPALFDNAVNAVTQHTGNGLFLPLSYKHIDIYKKMPPKVFAHIRLKDGQSSSAETIAFDIDIMDLEGNCICEIEKYVIKKADIYKAINQNHIGYTTSWTPLPMTSSTNTKSTQKNRTIILISNCQVNEQIITYMKNSNNVIQLYFGYKDSKQTENDSYNIQGTVNEYEKIFNSFIETKVDIIFMFENGHFTEDNEAEITKDCLYQFKYIISSLTNKGIRVNKMTLFANQVYSVTSQESVINPAGAALFGMVKCLPYEFPKMKVQMFDYDTMDHENFVSSLSSPSNKAVISIRNRTFYEEELIDIDREKTDNIIDFNQNGLYIITGGYGDLGMEIINSLQGKNITNIAVLGRSPENNIHSEKLERIRLLNKQGMNVFYRQLSVENMEALDEFLQEMRERYKKIGGIIHAAGVPGEQYLFRTLDEQMESILAPKILGTYNLDELTKNDALSFFIVFSSVVTLYGAPGQTVYTAANSYMDAIIAQRKKDGHPALSIKWAPWKETGMAYRYKNKDDGYFSMIDTGEAIELFHLVMGIKNGIFVLGSLNTALIKANMENQYLKISTSIRNTEKQNELKSSPAKNSIVKSICFMSGRDDSDYTDIEKNLANIWSNILERQDIDIFMSFFDMGGDSIFATRMLTFIEKDYPDYVDIADIFDYQTIYDLAQYIDKKMNENIQSPSSMDELMEEILQGNISIDEGLKVLNISKEEEKHE